MKEVLKNYFQGMATYDHCHQPSIASQWLAFKSELIEFMEKPSFEEIWDVLHSAGRLFWKVTGIPWQLLAYPTVYKHSQRFVKNGCIRSIRNCEGRCCNGNQLT